MNKIHNVLMITNYTSCLVMRQCILVLSSVLPCYLLVHVLLYLKLIRYGWTVCSLASLLCNLFYCCQFNCFVF